MSGYFGNTYFEAGYYGGGYWGGAASPTPTPVPPVLGGGGWADRERAEYRKRKRRKELQAGRADLLARLADLVEDAAADTAPAIIREIRLEPAFVQAKADFPTLDVDRIMQRLARVEAMLIEEEEITLLLM